MLTSKTLAGSMKKQASPYGTSQDVTKQAVSRVGGASHLQDRSLKQQASPSRQSPDVNKQAVGRVSEEAS